MKITREKIESDPRVSSVDKYGNDPKIECEWELCLTKDWVFPDGSRLVHCSNLKALWDCLNTARCVKN